MSSKFNIELAQGTITVEGDQDFIMSVYQALQSTLLSDGKHSAAPAPAETREAAEPEVASAEKNPEPDTAPAQAEAESPVEAKVTPINAAEDGPEPAQAAIEAAALVYEPIPSVLDPNRAERERAEAEAQATEGTGEEATEEAEEELSVSPKQNVVLEQIKESLGDEADSGGQTSILQRIRDSLSEDASSAKDEDTPRAADAS